MHDWFKHLNERRDARQASGLTRELRIARGAGIRFEMFGRTVVSFGSNDYLGLATHPEVIAAGKRALDEFGAGATSSPLICGYKTVHAELCAALAAFKAAESALVFPSGYQAALATLDALADDDTTVILDKLCHASLIDGAKLSGGRVRIFQHNDVADLEAVLEKEAARRVLVVVESLYSMDGDTAPLNEIVALTERFGSLLLVDEAHATGVLGADGHGLLGTEKLPRHVIALGTLSKALGTQGGFICASGEIVEAVLIGRAHLFSTALNPGSAGAALAALKLVGAPLNLNLKVLTLAEQVRAELKRGGVVTPSTSGPIIPAMIGDEKRAAACSKSLLTRGFYVPAVRYPTVKKGEARLRISVSAGHTVADCEALARAVIEICASE